MRNKLFGRRIGKKLSTKKRSLIENILPKHKLDITSFPDTIGEVPISKINFEIGSGMGDFIIDQATRNPTEFFIATEPYLNGISKILEQIEELKLQNIKIWPDDFQQILEYIPDRCISKMFILFPDPWPKNKHKKRRLINSPVLSVLVKKLNKGGKIYLASDIKEYIEEAKNVLASQQELNIELEQVNKSYKNSVETKYAQKAASLKKDRFYLIFSK